MMMMINMISLTHQIWSYIKCDVGVWIRHQWDVYSPNISTCWFLVSLFIIEIRLLLMMMVMIILFSPFGDVCYILLIILCHWWLLWILFLWKSKNKTKLLVPNNEIHHIQLSIGFVSPIPYMLYDQFCFDCLFVSTNLIVNPFFLKIICSYSSFAHNNLMENSLDFNYILNLKTEKMKNFHENLICGGGWKYRLINIVWFAIFSIPSNIDSWLLFYSHDLKKNV